MYFVYGINYSRENKRGQGYGRMVEYKGDATLPENTITGLSEEVKELQPARKEEGLYQWGQGLSLTTIIFNLEPSVLLKKFKSLHLLNEVKILKFFNKIQTLKFVE